MNDGSDVLMDVDEEQSKQPTSPNELRISFVNGILTWGI